MLLTAASIDRILTRTSGFLGTVSSHSLQPYRGCALGNSLCGVGCYVQHNWHLTRGERWGSFIEARTNAADSYRRQYAAEKAWARRNRGLFGIFLSSSTEPFQPLERTARITRQVLEAMLDAPPDFLILQSHSHHLADYADLYRDLAGLCDLRLHLSIESDRDELPGLPRSASPVAKRMQAAQKLREAGLRVVITVSPLLPIESPEKFFADLAKVADAVVIDHFIGGDGSAAGSRTRSTPLAGAMAAIDPESVTLAYRDRMIEIARRHFPGRTGVNIDGFAGRMSATGAVGPKPE
jgi:DNA repair photolyase